MPHTCIQRCSLLPVLSPFLSSGNPSKNGIGSLVLGPLRTDQAGLYTCVAKNDAGKVEYPFELRVKTRPRVQVYQSDEPIKVSEPTRLRCDVSGDADSVVWLKDGDVVSNSSRISITDQGKNLVIRMTKVSGREACSVTGVFFLKKRYTCLQSLSNLVRHHHRHH
ncbi:hypothetical protein AHF37_12469 [Paragonimus kellicotti]|nr:hypothetical protein AHF37_12469 [Paragonimus kellicotti]